MSKKFIELFRKIKAFRDFVDPDNDAQFGSSSSNASKLISGDLEGGSFSLNRAALLSSMPNVYPRSLANIINQHVEPNASTSTDDSSESEAGSNQGSNSSNRTNISSKVGGGIPDTTNLDNSSKLNGVEEVTGGGKSNLNESGGDPFLITDIDITNLKVGDTILIGDPPNVQERIITELLPPNGCRINLGLSSPPQKNTTGPFSVNKKNEGGTINFGGGGSSDVITGLDTSNLNVGDTIIVGESPNTQERVITEIIPPNGVRVGENLTKPPLDDSGGGGSISVKKKNSTVNSTTGTIDLNDDPSKICGLNTSNLNVGDTIIVGGALDAEVQTRVVSEILGSGCVKVSESFSSGTGSGGTIVKKYTPTGNDWYFSSLWGWFWTSSRNSNWIWSNKFNCWVYVGLLESVGGKPAGPCWLSIPSPGQWCVVGGGKVFLDNGSEKTGDDQGEENKGENKETDLDQFISAPTSTGGGKEIESGHDGGSNSQCPPGLNENTGSGNNDTGGEGLKKLYTPLLGWFLWNGDSNQIYIEAYEAWVSFPGPFDPFNIVETTICKFWKPDGTEGNDGTNVTITVNPFDIKRENGTSIPKEQESNTTNFETTTTVTAPPSTVVIEGESPLPDGWYFSDHFGIYYISYPWIYSLKWNGWWFVGEIPEEGHGSVGWVYFGTTEKWYWLLSPNIYKITGRNAEGADAGNDVLEPEEFSITTGHIKITNAQMEGNRAKISFVGNHSKSPSTTLFLYRHTGGVTTTWENFGAHSAGEEVIGEEYTGGSAAAGQVISLKWDSTDIESERFTITAEPTEAASGGGGSSGGGQESPKGKDNVDVGITFPHLFNHPVFGECIVMQEQDPLTKGWFFSIRFGWIWGDSTQNWFYIVDFSDWFWFGLLLSNEEGEGWVFSQSKQSWWWNSFGNFTNVAGEDYFFSGGGSFENSSAVGGSGATTELITVNGESIVLVNGETIDLYGEGQPSSGDGSSNSNVSSGQEPSEDEKANIVDAQTLLVSDRITNVLSYRTITDADGSIEVPDQVEVLGGEVICADIMLNDSTTASWELSRVLNSNDVMHAYDTYMSPHGFLGSSSNLDGGYWIGKTWGDLKFAILHAHESGDFRYINNCKRIQIEPENTSILII